MARISASFMPNVETFNGAAAFRKRKPLTSVNNPLIMESEHQLMLAGRVIWWTIGVAARLGPANNAHTAIVIKAERSLLKPCSHPKPQVQTAGSDQCKNWSNCVRKERS